MPNTTNFNWPTPADTDLVKDGAAAIRNLGNGIDTSLIDLKGGTTGQILSKASNADMDFTFITPNVGDITEVQAGAGISIASGTGPIPVITNSSTDLITTAGDLLYGTAADTMARLGIGTAGQVLKVNSGATAPEWGAAAGGSSGLTLISRQTLSAAASVSFDGVFTSTYQAYICIIEDLLSSSQFNLDMRLKYSTNTEVTTGYYGTSFDGATQTDTSNGSAFRMSQGGISSDVNEFSNMHILFSPMNKSGRGVVSGFGGAGKTNKPISFMGVSTDIRTYTGCSFFLSAGNMTGTFSMYGLAKS